LAPDRSQQKASPLCLSSRGLPFTNGKHKSSAPRHTPAGARKLGRPFGERSSGEKKLKGAAGGRRWPAGSRGAQNERKMDDWAANEWLAPKLQRLPAQLSSGRT